MNNNKGNHLIFGDFNEVRHSSERIGTMFNPSSMNVFNQFIRDAQLWDIPLGGHLFTRLNKHGNKLSKLDRFLASESFAPFLQKISGHVLECHISDHRPILFTPISVDFGPTPFKFYNSWLLDKTLHTSINDFWINFIPGNSTNPIVAFKNKMKALKIVIKEWSLNPKDARTHLKEDLISKIKALDADFTNGSSSTDAKIKWCVEADDNTKFFHAMVNQKRRYLAIHGIKFEGRWIEDPTGIKDVFTNFFEQKFQQIQVVNIINRSPFYKSINSDQTMLLDAPVLDSEIKNAIWDCGSKKSPGPDGYSFAFYKELWNLIQSDVLGFRKVNNGASTKVWHDSWNGNSPFKLQFPRLFRLSRNRDCLVRDCWNNGWHLDWVRDISNGSNTAHLAILQSYLSPITLSESEDAWVWTVDTSSFSVKSARRLIDRDLHP
nr:RNA-directed DNA polymerase, eukaryota, reverse transcriptase zinc-binding domain protein [Tanacetum cinerariifolium]